MDNVCLGAYATLQEAEDAKSGRQEPQNQLTILEDGDELTPFRIWWNRTA
jgi:hypothetical protein